MRYLGFRLIPASLAFVIGVTLCTANHFRLTPSTPKPRTPPCEMPNDLQDITNVNFDELLANPVHYDGWIVRTQVIMAAFSAYEPRFDHVYLYAPNGGYLSVNDKFHLTSRTCPENLQTLDSLLTSDAPPFEPKRAAVTVVGEFRCSKVTRLETGQNRPETPLLTIVGIERVTSVPAEVPWLWP